MAVMNKNKQRFNKGAALIEMALVILILFLLTFGAIEYGWLFLKAQEITHVAREAARTGCVDGATTEDVVNSINATMTAVGMADMIGYVNYDDPEAVPIGDQYSVDVNLPVVDANLGLINAPLLLPLPTYLKASVSMMKEGP